MLQKINAISIKDLPKGTLHTSVVIDMTLYKYKVNA